MMSIIASSYKLGQLIEDDEYIKASSYKLGQLIEDDEYYS